MIELNGISKSFDKKIVLKDISFCVHPGEFVTIIGKIGSGKSTILNIISGLMKYDSGELKINGKVIKTSNRSYIKDIGVLLSCDYLIEEFSTILYWRCMGKLLGLTSSDINHRIEYINNICQISDPNIPISKLSSGNKMLVKIGTMLLKESPILIIDEPFVNLDINEIEKVERILSNCNLEGKTILMTSHYPESIYKISNKIYVLDNGKIEHNFSKNDFQSYEIFKLNFMQYFNKSLISTIN